MPGQRLGSLIGAVFGLVYILANSGALPPAARLVLRALGIVAFLVVVIAVHPWRRRAAAGGNAPAPGGTMRRTYWLIVAAEVAALAAGLRLLNGPLHTPGAGVAWVSTVVGAHFFALGAAFRQQLFHYLGAAVTACGVAGLGLVAGGGAPALVAVVSGIVPGILLLIAGWSGAHDRSTGTPRPSRSTPGRPSSGAAGSSAP